MPTSIFSEGMPVSVEGRIKADVVANEVTLKIDCKADDKIEGELYPSKESWNEPVKEFFRSGRSRRFSDLFVFRPDAAGDGASFSF